jgi:hypothetical protein
MHQHMWSRGGGRDTSKRKRQEKETLEPRRARKPRAEWSRLKSAIHRASAYVAPVHMACGNMSSCCNNMRRAPQTCVCVCVCVRAYVCVYDSKRRLRSCVFEQTCVFEKNCVFAKTWIPGLALSNAHTLHTHSTHAAHTQHTRSTHARCFEDARTRGRPNRGTTRCRDHTWCVKALVSRHTTHETHARLASPTQRKTRHNRHNSDTRHKGHTREGRPPTMKTTMCSGRAADARLPPSTVNSLSRNAATPPILMAVRQRPRVRQGPRVARSVTRVARRVTRVARSVTRVATRVTRVARSVTRVATRVTRVARSVTRVARSVKCHVSSVKCQVWQVECGVEDRRRRQLCCRHASAVDTRRRWASHGAARVSTTQLTPARVLQRWASHGAAPTSGPRRSRTLLAAEH